MVPASSERFTWARRLATVASVSRIFTTSVASVYPHYVAKVERKGRTKAELDQVIEWLTGYDQPSLEARLADGTDTTAAFMAALYLRPSWKM